MMKSLILTRLEKIKDYNEIYKIPRSIFFGKKPGDISSLNIGFVVNSCFGFGDVIFTFKLLTYFKKWYNMSPIVFTTQPHLFTSIGLPQSQVKRLAVPGVPIYDTCDYTVDAMVAYEFKGNTRKRYKPKQPFDCMFVTPWVGDNDTVNTNAIQKIFPGTNKFNTFVFSAYNRVKKNEKSLFDFDMGLGDGRLGLMYYKSYSCGKRPIKNPYVISYVADNDVDGLGCIEKFIKRVISKYHDIHDKLEILVPMSITEDGRLDKLVDYITKKYNYDVLISRSSKETKSAHTRQGKYVLFRADIQGVPYLEYLDYICNALPEILVTGNQSVSDILECCPEFNIFYQIMPWEKQFAKELGNASGVKDLGLVSKSCGHTGNTNLDGIYKSNDFEKKGKKYLDAVLNSVIGIKSDATLAKFVELASRSRKTSTLIKKLSKVME